MSTPVEPGLYFFTDKIGRRLLVEVRRGPKNDGNGPLFAEAFRRDNDGAYFYCDVGLLVGGEWQGPLELDHERKPVDAMAREIFDSCIANGTAPGIPFLTARLCLTPSSTDADAREQSTGRPSAACHVTPL